MSRSIHVTRRQLAELRRVSAADRTPNRESFHRFREELGLDRKHRIRELVAMERKLPGRVLAPAPSEAIPVQLRDEGPYVHYPATPGDLRAVMDRLPPGVLHGLSSIDLCLGAPEQEEAGEDWEGDPFLGRQGVEILPGVFGGPVLGRYSADGARIQLFAYVYDPTLAHRELKELYLRLRLLATFVHEVGHHHDLTAPVARGRWIAHSKEDRETYAERMEHQWTQEIVVPYLEETYPEELRALQDWLEHHGGLRLPLSFLAEDPPTLFTVCLALEMLFTAVADGDEPTATRITFARYLHHAEHYTEARQILARVLAEQKTHPEALTLEACIDVDEGAYDRAAAICGEVIARDAACIDTWMVLSEAHWHRRRWGDVLRATTRAIELRGADGIRSWRSLFQRARAHLELGDFPALEADLDALSQTESSLYMAQLRALRAIALLRQERLLEAFESASAMLQEKPAYWERCEPELRAVRFDAAHRLGRSAAAGTLPSAMRATLRDRAYDSWVDRLDAIAR
jgi:tetratricopeptide (TPR) repeat protein